MLTGEDDTDFALQKFTASFETHEIPPGLYEVDDSKTFLNKLMKASFSIGNINVKS